jgi:uncharacterized protein (TIGR00725 family)
MQKNTARFIKYKIALSGAADTALCSPDALEKTEELGRLIAKHGMILVTGATTGAPEWAAKGAKSAGGFVLGLSPAISEYAHINTFHLPTDYHDIILYTGLGYSGRDLQLTRSADAIITVCGRIGTLNEFTNAFEDGKVQGVLKGSGGESDLIPDIIKRSGVTSGKVVFESDPATLLEKIIAVLEEERKKNIPPTTEFEEK